MEWLFILGVATAIFVGTNIGGSLTGAAFGPATGSGVLSMRLASGLMAAATHASVNEGDGEAADESPADDLHSAGEQLSASYENATGNDPDAAVEHGGDSLDYAARAADSAGRKLLRTVEETVYEEVMTRVSPYYFDNDLISANLRRSGTGLVSDDDEFVLEVDISDDDLKSDVADRLDEYETLDRWHGETRITTDTVKAAEGAELAD